MLTLVRRFMEWIAKRVNGQATVSENYVCVTLVGVLVSAFMTDLIGIHPLFGAFVFGLIVPAEGNFAKMLVEKVEDFVTVLILPLFFASSGLKTNLGSINSAKSIGFLVLLVLVTASGKIITSAVVGMVFELNVREAFAFGFLMNTKGLVELIVLNIGLDLGVFDAQTFAILVLMCLILMFFTTPGLMALYKPVRKSVPYIHHKLEGSNKKSGKLRILACVHGTRSIPALLSLVEACRVSSNKRPIKLFPLHVIELTERTLSIITLGQTASQDGKMHAPTGDHDGIFVAFQAYGRISKVPVKLLSVVSQLSDMHYDVCNLAAEKRATMIILPYSLYQKEDGTVEHINNPGFKAVNQRIMQNAPCSVGILVDRGPWGLTQLSDTNASYKVAVAFFGGPDDREALAFACWPAEHQSIHLWVLRFKPKEGEGQINDVIDIDNSSVDKVERKNDEDFLAMVKLLTNTEAEDSRQSIHYEEHLYEDCIGAVVSMANSSEFLLLMVGRQTASTENNENSELCTLGDALANAGGEMKASILVIQQHNSSFTHNDKDNGPINTPTKELRTHNEKEKGAIYTLTKDV